MIPSSRDEDGQERKRERERERGRNVGSARHPLFSAVASFRDVSIDFISCGCITAMRSRFKARS